MRTIIYTNSNFGSNKKRDFWDLILGVIFIVISCSGLFMGSKFILKLFMYIIPVTILLYAINIYRIAFSLFKSDSKHFVIFLLQGLVLTVFALWFFLFPMASVNYIVIFIGAILIINSINTMMLTSSKTLSFTPFLLGLILILFSNQIINTFYVLFLIVLLFMGISKLIWFIYKLK